MSFHLVRVATASALIMLLAVTSSCTVTREDPDLTGQDIRLTILHTSDIHSRLFPYFTVPSRFDQEDGLLPQNAPFGGAARMATVIREEREQAGRSLWLDSGDSFQGAPVFNLFKGEAEFRTLSEMGIDGAVVGNHEFDLGSANLTRQADTWAQFPILAANYVFEDPPNPNELFIEDVLQPYTIYDIDGLRIGVIGMANHSSMTGIFEGGNSLGIRPREEAEVVREYVRLLRPTVDVLVLLSHLGLDEDEGLAANQIEADLNENLPLAGVDIILGGHLHIVLDPPKTLPNDQFGNKTVLAHSGAFAKYIGRLDIVVRVGENNSDPETRSKVTGFSYKNIPIDSTIKEDRDVTDLLWPYSVELNQQIDLDGVFAYTATPNGARITRNEVNGGDSQLGNLVARAMQIRTGVEADFALTNSLGIRADFEQGPLTIEQMFNVFPFENSITVMFLSGVEIQEMLDFVARRSASRGCRTQAQVAGLWFDMICSGDCPSGASACAKNIFLGENCRNGDPEGPIDTTKCAPVVPTGLYKAAVNDFIARGGSGFEVLKRNTSKQDTGVPLRDALIDFLRTQKTCDGSVVDVMTGEPVVEQYGSIACLDQTVEPPDGRIRPIFE